MAVFRDRHPMRRILPLILLITATGALLSLLGLGTKSLSIDEATSWRIASLPWSPFGRVLWDYEANMAFYYLLLSGWMAVFGDGVLAMRCLSVLFGVATAPAVYLLGRRLVGAGPALIAAALLATHALEIWFAQEARGYSLVVLLLTLSTHSFVRAVEGPQDRSAWTAYAATGVLACYTHVFAALVLASHWLSLDARRWRRIGARRTATLALTFTILLAPLAAFVLLHDKGQLAWIPPVTVRMILWSLLALAGWNAAMVVVLVAGLALAIRSPWRDAEHAWALRLVALGTTIPIVVIGLASIAKPLFFFRYLGVSVPAAVVLAGYTLSRASDGPRRRRILSGALVGVVIAASLLLDVYFQRVGRRLGNNWPAAVQHILARREARDAVVFFKTSGFDAYCYYKDRVPAASLPSALPDLVFPTADQIPSAQNVPDPEWLRNALRGRHRVWVVFHHVSPPKDAVVRRGVEDFRLSEETTFPGLNASFSITVALYEAQLPSSPSRDRPYGPNLFASGGVSGTTR